MLLALLLWRCCRCCSAAAAAAGAASLALLLWPLKLLRVECCVRPLNGAREARLNPQET